MRRLVIAALTLLALVAACGKGETTIQYVGCRDDMDCPGGSFCLRADAGLRCVEVQDAGGPPTGTPALELSAAALDFGAPLPGAVTTRELVLTSVGDAPLDVYEARLIEDDARAEFGLDAPGVPATLAPGESTTITVTLIPADAEPDGGYLLLASSDPARAATLIPLVSWVKGLPTLEVCVDQAAPPATCADPPAFAFGTVAYGTGATRVARLRNANEGNATLTVTAVTAPAPPAVPTDLFTVELFTLAGGVETTAALPFMIGPQQSTPDLYVRLAFNGAIDRELPSMSVAVATEGTAAPTAPIPITWTIDGCPDGYRDLRDDLPGCEYACPVWPPVTETCNDQDDDCDDAVDNGFDLSRDPDNCGFCGHRCDLPHSTATCDNAICTITACADGYANVNGTHADGCEYACPVWPATSEACNNQDDDCDGQTDEDFPLQSDPHNCGSCGHDCLAQGLVCSAGACVLTCPPGTTNCSGACVDLDTDPAHCGSCTKVCAFAHATATCIDRTCVMGPCLSGYANLDRNDATGCEHTCQVWPPVAETCNDQDDDCDGQTDETFDKQNDPANCGSCGHGCSFPHATALCVAGQCRMGACDNGYRDLRNGATDGCEYQCPVMPVGAESCNGKDDNCDGLTDETFDKQNDPANCNTCGHVCSFPRAQALCVAGQCRMGACLDGYRDLANGDADGCEYECPVWPPVAEACNGKDDNCDGLTDETFDKQNDPLNCTTCGHVCAFPHAQALCVAGQCVMGPCAVGYRDLANGATDGCEYQCPVMPLAAETCNGKDDNCDGQTDETFDTQNDPLNCTTCGHVCSFPHAQALCVAGQCVMGPCAVGYRDLANGATDGCEYQCPVMPLAAEACNGKDDNCDGLTDETFDTQNDPLNCTTCGHVCSFPHAQALCVAGQCRMGACLDGYRDISGGESDGCEYLCPEWPPTDEACNGKDDDCDGLTDETFDLINDPANCGSCNHNCALSGTQVACVDRQCDIVGCLAGYYDLNGGTDGCEYHCATNPPSVEVCNHQDDDCDGLTDEGYDTATDPNHCGDCGIKCATSQICCAGACVANDEVNCGYCGRACDAGVDCFGGACIEPGIVIVTEMMIDPKGVTDALGEWFEVFNTTGYPVNLNGWRLRDEHASNPDSHTISDDVWVPAHGFVVLGKNANYPSNGGVIVDYQYASFDLGNGDDVVVLEVPLPTPFVVNRVGYSSTWYAAGQSAQLDPDHFNGADNDTAANWCKTSKTGGHVLASGDFGTPGAPNEQCP
jgi:hypothetical protein